MAWRKRDRNERPPPAAKPQAIKLLSRREHSARELTRKLTDRGIETGAAEEAIAGLARAGLQSDDRYAGQLIRTRVAQGYGPRRIRAEMEQAGLARDSIEQALATADCDWRALAAQQRAKKFGPPPGTTAERIRQQRFLYARGFESDQIQSVLKADFDES